MICPVCKQENTFDFDYCDFCGFNKLRTEFFNEDDYLLWLKETVEPCRSVYYSAYEKYKKLLVEYNSLKEEYIDLQEKYKELSEAYSNLEKIKKSDIDRILEALSL